MAHVTPFVPVLRVKRHVEIVQRELTYLTRHLTRRAILAKKRAARIIAKERDDPQTIRRWQAARLIHSLQQAAQVIPAHVGIRSVPDGEAVFDFVRDSLPVVAKADLLSGRDQLYPNGGRRRAWWLAGHTSGTTGSPLEIFRSLDSVIWEEAFHLQTWHWHGISPGAPQAVLRGDLVTLSSENADRLTLWDPWGRQLFMATNMLSSGNVRDFVSAIEDRGCVALRAYPSAAFELARLVEEAGLTLRFRVVIAGSEPLYAVQREIIERVFGCSAVDFYGMAERVAYAAQCERGHLHLNSHYSFVEILGDNGQPTDEFGDVVGTTYWNEAMPLLRYRLSDRARWVPGCCPCGRTYPRIELSSGKAEDQLFDGTGKPVSASIITFAFKSAANIERTQVAQVGQRTWEVRIVPGPGYADGIGDQVISSLRQFVSADVDYRLRLVERIPSMASGKFKWVSQEWKAR